MADRSNPLPLAPGKLTRRKLYDLVWSTPRRLLAPAFACSDTWLKGMCRESCVPTPHRAYWAKVAAAKKPKRRELPRGLVPDEVVIEVSEQPQQDRQPASAPQPAPLKPDVAALLARIETMPLSADLSNGYEASVDDHRAPWPGRG
jgi:hypothetical protein